MDSLKVAYLLLRFPCITETFVAEEIQKLQDTGVEVCIYSLLAPRETLVQPVSATLLPLVRTAPGNLNPILWAAQFHYLFNAPGLYFKLLWTFLRQPAPAGSFYLKRLAIFFKSVWVARDLELRRVQMVHTHFAWLSAAGAWIAAQLLGIPFTVTTHAYDIYSEQNDLLTLTTQQAARVITISNNNKRAMLEMDSRLAGNKIHVIHCGVDLSFFQQKLKRDDSSAISLQITSVGSLIEKKGHEYLIRACGVLKEKGLPFCCVIVGAGSLEPNLRKLISDLGLAGQVNLAGTRSQDWVRNRLCESDIFALACIRTGSGGQDGIPVALMEALAMGVPVISTPVSGIPEMIRDGDTGLLVAERDVQGLAQAITRVMQEPALRQTLRCNGRRLVENDYNIMLNVRRLKYIFSEVVKEYEFR